MKTVPEERKFSPQHVWIKMQDEFAGRCGISDGKQTGLGTIVFVVFPETGIEVRAGEKVGTLESEKDFFSINTPVSGVIIEINRNLESNPDLINSDPYGDGWIYAIDVKEPNEFHDLLDDSEYEDVLLSEGDI